MDHHGMEDSERGLDLGSAAILVGIGVFAAVALCGVLVREGMAGLSFLTGPLVLGVRLALWVLGGLSGGLAAGWMYGERGVRYGFAVVGIVLLVVMPASVLASAAQPDSPDPCEVGGEAVAAATYRQRLEEQQLPASVPAAWALTGIVGPAGGAVGARLRGRRRSHEQPAGHASD